MTINIKLLCECLGQRLDVLPTCSEYAKLLEYNNQREVVGMWTYADWANYFVSKFPQCEFQHYRENKEYHAEYKHNVVVPAASLDDCYKMFHRLNDQVRYMDNTYYAFTDKSYRADYVNWYRGLSESERFNLSYPTGLVD